MTDGEDLLKKIHGSALKFLEPLTPQQTYEIIVREAKRLVKAQNGSIFLKNNKSFQRVYATSPTLYHINPRKRGYVYKAFTTRHAISIEGKVLLKNHPEMKRFHINSIVYIPLSYRQKSMGVMVIDSHEDRKFGEKELDALKLFGSVATLAIRKAQLYSDSQQALEARDLFISLASHEIRTPLTAMSGYIQLLNKRFEKGNTTEARWTKELYKENIRLTNLVRELFEINRIKTGKFEYVMRECSLHEILNRVITNFHFSYPNHTLIVKDTLPSGDRVVGDVDKLIQALTNILTNAAKFSPPGKDIVLAVTAKKPFFSITIHDQGKGIEKERLDHIFDGFAKRSDELHEGLGLGLVLADHILTYHHGSITIDSEINKGTSVDIKLPQIMHK